jgi:tRNA threonylcarbamoyladenosine biosynthesis protein TsaE
VPILRPGELDIISHSAEQTQRLGARLGSLLSAVDVICLSGEMGAGKTVFTAGIGRGWGAKTPITSPTFTLVHEHQREQNTQRLYHLDCYRLQDADDTSSIDLDEILDGHGPVIVEWPEHIEGLLPPQRLWIELRIIERTRRNLTFEGSGTRYENMIKQFRDLTFGI